MPIEKPPELRDWLREHNYTFLGVNLFIGDWIEIAIDWLLEWINYFISWGEALYAWAVDLRQEVIEWFDKLTADIQDVWSWLSTQISAWWGELALWWADKTTIILGWIDAATQGFSELKAAWDSFWTQTLPSLINISWLTSWWRGKLPDIKSLIDSTLLEWFPDYNNIRDTLLDVKEFFIDPLKWLYDKLENFMDKWW